MRWTAGLLVLAWLQVFPPAAGGEEGGGAKAADAGISAEDLPVIRNLELLELLDLLRDMDLLQGDREDSSAEDER